jgi:K+/H+ antiporter YhaU regulatory subunit KhtT
VVAIEKDGEFSARPSPTSALTADSQLVIVADAESERLFSVNQIANETGRWNDREV